MINRAQIIKSRVKMPDVLARYGFEPRRRMKCPLHNGSGDNFAFTAEMYTCFSHCGSGDVITFVQKLFGIDFNEALRKLDSDFSLGLFDTQDIAQIVRMNRKAQSLEEKHRREENERKRLENEYWAAFDEWKRLDDNKRKYKPAAPCDELHPLFAEAIGNIHHQWQKVCECETRCRA